MKTNTSAPNPSTPEATRPAFELDHAKDGDTRYFVIHGRLPQGLNAEYGYPICDSMNRHHCISPEEDEAYGRLIVRAVNSYDDMLSALKAARAVLGEAGSAEHVKQLTDTELGKLWIATTAQIDAVIALAGAQ